MRFTVGIISRTPSGMDYWEGKCEFLSAWPGEEVIATVDIPISSTSLWESIITPAVDYESAHILYRACNSTGSKVDTWHVTEDFIPQPNFKYNIDYHSGKLFTGEWGFSPLDLLPMSPLEGPPLPRFLGIYWPWRKE